MIRRMHDDAKTFAQELGARLEQARRAKNLTQGMLAFRTKIHWTSIAHFEAGRHSPPAHKLRALAVALSVSADFLLGLTDDPTPRSSSGA